MRICTWVFLAGLVAGPALANDKDDRERVLKQFFEGRLVTVRVDMPATQQGIAGALERLEIQPPVG
jgi:hypothetical protein